MIELIVARASRRLKWTTDGAREGTSQRESMGTHFCWFHSHSLVRFRKAFYSRVILKRNGEYIYKEVSSEGARPGGVVSLSCE